MTCTQLDELLDRLMDGELTDEERQALEAHGQTCPACAEATRATLRMKALFDEMEPEVDVPLAAQAKWRGAVREAAGQGRRRKLIRWIGSAAAAVVVLVGVGLAMNTRGAPVNGARTQKAELAGDQAAEVTLSEADGAYEAAPMRTPEATLPPAAETDGAGEAAMVEADGAYEAAPVNMAAGDDTAIAAEDMAFGSMAEDAALDRGASYDAGGAGEYAVEASEVMPVEEAYEADSFEDAEYTVIETDGEGTPMCAALAQRAPACELRMAVDDVPSACERIRDIAAEYEAQADVQPIEDGGANVYVDIAALDAGDFLDALAAIGAVEGRPGADELSASGTVLMLLVVDAL